jgi:hypothetical protein
MTFHVIVMMAIAGQYYLKANLCVTPALLPNRTDHISLVEYVQSNRVIFKRPLQKENGEDFHRRNGRDQRKEGSDRYSATISASGVESDIVLHSPHHGFVLLLDVSPRAAIVI